MIYMEKAFGAVCFFKSEVLINHVVICTIHGLVCINHVVVCRIVACPRGNAYCLGRLYFPMLSVFCLYFLYFRGSRNV